MVIHVVTTKPSLLVTINDAGWGTPSDAYSVIAPVWFLAGARLRLGVGRGRRPACLKPQMGIPWATTVGGAKGWVASTPKVLGTGPSAKSGWLHGTTFLGQGKILKRRFRPYEWASDARTSRKRLRSIAVCRSPCSRLAACT